MIMMRSNPATKLGGKPPPPVPPRPSKSLVQEALAKTRKVSRPAPPPPSNDLAKSKSSVNIVLKKPVSYDRSISEEIKGSSRPIVYMSSNVKPINKEVNKNGDCEKTVHCENHNVNLIEKIDCDDANSIEKCDIKSGEDERKTNSTVSSASSSNSSSLDKKWDKMLNDRNHVNTLIDEMFASVLEVSGLEDTDTKSEPEVNARNETTQIKINNNSQENINGQVEAQPKTVIIIKDDTTKNEINDKLNHELLINELQHMKMDQERIMRRQRKPSMNIYDREEHQKLSAKNSNGSDVSKIHCSDWIELGDGGKEVHLSSCQITIEDFKKSKDIDVTLDCERISKMSSLHGLPPLPKSLSGFNILDNQPGHGTKPPTPVRTSSIRSGQSGQHAHLVHPPQKITGQPDSLGRKHTTNMDSQLAILRREMFSLRQLDLSLLSQLWSLNESIQDFRQMLQDQDDRILMPPSPSPTNSSGDEGDADDFFSPPTATTTLSSTRSLRPAPPPPPIRRPSSSSNGSSLG